eukprot:7107219-Pyramimonas_sp.AAC.1
MKLVRYRRYVTRALRIATTTSDTTAWDNLKKYSATDGLTKAIEQDAWFKEARQMYMILELYDDDSGGELSTGARLFLAHTKPILTKLLRHDRAAHLEKIAKELQGSIANHDGKQEGAATRALLRYGGRIPSRSSRRSPAGGPAPYNEDDDGKVLDNDEEVARSRLVHFAKQEDATLLSTREVKDRYNTEVNTAAMHTELELEQIPPLPWLQH